MHCELKIEVAHVGEMTLELVVAVQRKAGSQHKPEKGDVNTEPDFAPDGVENIHPLFLSHYDHRFNLLVDEIITYVTNSIGVGTDSFQHFIVAGDFPGRNPAPEKKYMFPVHVELAR